MNKLLQRAVYKLPNLLWAVHSLPEYARLLDAAKTRGYAFITLGELNAAAKNPNPPFMILRHDIDTNPLAALAFAEIEASRGLKATYFFRISTWHPEIMQILHQRGFEIGYHFEELSAYAIRNHLKDKELVLAKLPQIRESFAENIARLRQSVNFEISSFAAHGDFTYPVLDLGNRCFLQDQAFRDAQKVAYEAYDDHLVKNYGHHISDKPAPQKYYPQHPRSCIERRENLLLLTHPRWWIPDLRGNLRSDITNYYRQIRW